MYDTSTKPNKVEPSIRFIAITPSDTLDLPQPIRSLYIGSAGNIAVEDVDGNVVTFAGLVDSSILPIKPIKVMATDTTAADIVGLI
jgi:hypothetical protein|tara:strand:+ start:5808 stop:6065 length:258 start_codon:yes stop_codon:yes gene_type:complete